MTRIYWLSRHAPLPAQIEELARIFGEFQLVEDRRNSGCTEILVVVQESIGSLILAVKDTTSCGQSTIDMANLKNDNKTIRQSIIPVESC